MCLASNHPLLLNRLSVQGERVAVEAESPGTRIDGKVYHNQYHYLIWKA